MYITNNNNIMAPFASTSASTSCSSSPSTLSSNGVFPPSSTFFNIDLDEFYNPTSLWSFLTECLHWHYTGVYWPSTSTTTTKKQYGKDFFYTLDEVVSFCRNHHFHKAYQTEYISYMERKQRNKQVYCWNSNDTEEIFVPSRKKARTATSMNDIINNNNSNSNNSNAYSQHQLEFLQYFHPSNNINKENAIMTTPMSMGQQQQPQGMECN